MIWVSNQESEVVALSPSGKPYEPLFLTDYSNLLPGR